MPSISKWTIDLQTNTASFRKGLKGARKQAKDFGSSIKSLVGGPLFKLTAALGVAGGVAGFTFFIKRQFAAVDAIAKMSDAIGIQTEMLIGLQHGAALSGVETEALTKGLIRMQRNVADANDGLSTSVRVFKKLGLETKKLSRLSPDKQLAAIADGMKGLPDSTERTAVAMQIFGRAGAAMIPMLQEGSKGLEKFHETAKRLGLLLGRDAAAEIEIANNAITDLKAASTGMWRTLAHQLAPVVKITAQWIADMGAAARGAAGDMPTLFEGIVTGAVFAAAVVQDLALSFRRLQSQTTGFVIAGVKQVQAFRESEFGQKLGKSVNEFVDKYGYGPGLKPPPGVTTDFFDVFIEELEEKRRKTESVISGIETSDWGRRVGEALREMRSAIKKEAAGMAKLGGAQALLPGALGMPTRPGTFEQLVRGTFNRADLTKGQPGGRRQAMRVIADERELALLSQIVARLASLIPIMGP